MLLLRSGRKVVPLAQAGVPMHRRFTFYDQVHTTGMDNPNPNPHPHPHPNPNSNPDPDPDPHPHPHRHPHPKPHPDQVHTTGMDIKQAASARAALTLGKDMSFRDYAQGAYRMRGIGKGQTVELLRLGLGLGSDPSPSPSPNLN